MKKVLCLLYPSFSVYEIADLTSALALSFNIEIDYAASTRSLAISEDGLPCQPTKTLDEVNIADYACVILSGMMDLLPALHDKRLTSLLKTLENQEILIAAISSAPILLAKAGLLTNTYFTGGIWQNFFDYFDFLPQENFKPQAVLQDKNIITAVGFAHRSFARKVLTWLNLTNQAENFFKESTCHSESDFIFWLSEEDFSDFKIEFESYDSNN